MNKIIEKVVDRIAPKLQTRFEINGYTEFPNEIEKYWEQVCRTVLEESFWYDMYDALDEIVSEEDANAAVNKAHCALYSVEDIWVYEDGDDNENSRNFS